MSSCSSKWPIRASPRTGAERPALSAEAGVADYWIVNLREECIEVYRDPLGDSYRSMTVFRSGEVIPLLAFPTLAFPVSILFDEEDEEPDDVQG